MVSHDWFQLAPGKRLDASNHRRFTVDAALRWPLPTSYRQGLGVSCKQTSAPAATNVLHILAPCSL
jgi:hypothetical protein